MTLAELKKLFEAVTNSLKKFGKKENITQAVHELHSTLQKYYVNDPDADEKVSLAMREVNIVARNYMVAVQKLELLRGMLQAIVQKAEANGVDDSATIDPQLPPHYIQVLNLIVSAYTAALMQINIAYHNIQSNQVVYLSPNDLSATPSALNYIVSTMSGNFDLTACNVQLTSAQHTRLDINFICEGFYKDHDLTYFQNQIVNPLGRRRDLDPEASRKCTDFVDLYLKDTGLPESIRPNLTGLLSVLAYQSGVGGILYDQGINNVHVACQGGFPGEAFIANGGTYALQFAFAPNGTIKVDCMSTFYPPPTTYMFDNGLILKEGINFVQGITFDIKCDYAPNTGPVFTIHNFQRNLSCCLDKDLQNTIEWRVKQKTLSPHHQVDKKYFSFFENTAEYLIKFAGFNSVEALAEKANLTPSVLSIFSTGLYGQVLTQSVKAISPEESAFFDSLSLAFYRDHETPKQMAKRVTNFFVSQFYTDSGEDKTRYIYLLKMAADFAGFNYAPVKDAFLELLNGLSTNPSALFQALKKDSNFYHLYLQEMNKSFKWFSDLPEFSAEGHFEILNALNTNNDYFNVLVKNPKWLKENKHALAFLQQLPVEQKIVFLSYAQKTPELLKPLKEAFYSFSDQDMPWMVIESMKLGQLLTDTTLEVDPEVLSRVHNMMVILEKASQKTAEPHLQYLKAAEQTYLANMTARVRDIIEIEMPVPAKKTRAPMPVSPMPMPEKPSETAHKPEKLVEKPKKSIPAPEVTQTELEGTSPKELFNSFKTVLNKAEKKAEPYLESKKPLEEKPIISKEVEKKDETHAEKESAKKPSGTSQG